jgi:metal-responsive CopG/Arc/MetJ family transcriptional regulator
MAERVRMNIVISSKIRDMIDREAKKKDMSRSAVVRTAIMKYLGGKR